MITMCVCDDCLVYRLPGINEEISRFAIETFICEFNQQFAILLVFSNSKEEQMVCHKRLVGHIHQAIFPFNEIQLFILKIFKRCSGAVDNRLYIVTGKYRV